MIGLRIASVPLCLCASQLSAQEPSRPPVIDTITIATLNVFDSEDAQQNVLFRIANALHVTTRSGVVRQELLFKQGERLDPALVAETLRNLRRRGLFRDVRIDTIPVAGDSVWVHVTTADGWTTQLVMNGSSTGGEFTWALGAQEQNFLGTGTRVGVIYRDEPDRTALTLLAGLDRIGGSRWTAQGTYDDLSDGAIGVWNVGIPYRAFGDRWSVELWGEGADRRINQYRVHDFTTVDTTRFTRQALFNRLTASYAPVASPRGYVRLGIGAHLKHEEYVEHEEDVPPDVDPAATPDTVSGVVGAFAELVRANFKVVTHYNGFEREVDLDLSSRLTLSAWLAPAAFGYARTGVGPRVTVQTGVDFGRGFARLEGLANGLFTAAGLDSGRVWTGLTAAALVFARHATVFHMEAGLRDGLPPGAEFDLGHGFGPRGFGSHAFTGTRTVWGALEHRWFAVDEVSGVLGLGFAAFVDYGGAWYDDQPARFGGNVGAGLRFGPTRSTGPNIGRLDFAYRFGPGFEGKRWVVAFGRGFGF